jgi:hypothetical protein
MIPLVAAPVPRTFVPPDFLAGFFIFFVWLLTLPPDIIFLVPQLGMSVSPMKLLL